MRYCVIKCIVHSMLWQVLPQEWSAVRAGRCDAPTAHRCIHMWSPVVGGKTLPVPGWWVPYHMPWYGSHYVLRKRRNAGWFCCFSGTEQTYHNEHGPLLLVFYWLPRHGSGFVGQDHLEVQIIPKAGRAVRHGLTVCFLYFPWVDGVQLERCSVNQGIVSSDSFAHNALLTR